MTCVLAMVCFVAEAVTEAEDKTHQHVSAVALFGQEISHASCLHAYRQRRDEFHKLEESDCPQMHTKPLSTYRYF